MHELSIAQGIVEIVEQYVPQNRRQDVRSVTVKVGDHSGVVPDSLVFSFEAIVAGTELDSARLDIRRIPVVLRCLGCSAETGGESPVFACAACGENRLEMISGSELQVLEVELDDQSEEPS
jgi:hydrogenase nickel incorporation protein HypA/HybF